MIDFLTLLNLVRAVEFSTLPSVLSTSVCGWRCGCRPRMMLASQWVAIVNNESRDAAILIRAHNRTISRTATYATFKVHLGVTLLSLYSSSKAHTRSRGALPQDTYPSSLYNSWSLRIAAYWSDRKMFNITSRPPTSALAISDEPSIFHTHRRHPDEEAMQIDEAEDEYGLGESSTGAGNRAIVGPGERITSAKEYMRCVDRSVASVASS